ncbi:hypothetical protein BWQ96_09936 [Gracilariopsis chorda]|uniref:Uncharacterized protein n=1 Tax=Gracilariopsis chorda TaxID=448386 RepID=A0A2V3IEB8_9FLOR|nr:hypothetical protein BWQ96_09936 [Gracilariopsis chorda]|eukprot:PXF40358.1 hypothetical protein BWQ96_09936 [Gracilariopsis chorda]
MSNVYRSDAPEDAASQLLAQQLKGAVLTEDLEKILPTVDATSSTDLVLVVRSVYLLRFDGPRDVTAVLNDIKRAWSARANKQDGRNSVGSVLSADFIQEKTQTVTKAVAKVLDELGLKCDELKSRDGAPLPFHAPNIRKAVTMRRLLALWDS